MRFPTIGKSATEQSAWLLWLGLLVVIGAWVLIRNNHSVTPAYHEAAQHWIQGRNLYLNTGRGFLYLPQAALLHIPFSLLPTTLGEIGWRFLTISLFAFGSWRLCRLFEQSHNIRLFLPMTLLVLPLSSSGARNGQATLIIAGLMMLAACELALHRWNRATALLCLGFAFKPLTLVLMLLAGGVHRTMVWRLLLGTALVLIAPYLTQSPAYVTAQYVECLAMLRSAAQLGIEREWAHFFGMLQAVGLEVPEPAQTAVRFCLAFVTLLLARYAIRNLPASRSALYLYGLGGCYLMLFNPRTENNTYAMIAPVIGIIWAEALLIQRNYAIASLLAILSLGIVGSYEFGRRLLPDTRPVWLAPLMCLAFTIVLIARMLLESRRRALRDAPLTATTGMCPEAPQLDYGPV